MAIDAVALGQRVAEARQRAALTQLELATQVGLDRSTLAKIEAGTRRITALELADIAQALRTRLEWFLEAAPQSIVSYRNAHISSASGSQIDVEIERYARAVEFVTEQDHSLREAIKSVSPRAVPYDDAEAEALALEARKLMDVSVEDPLHNLDRKVFKAGLISFVIDLGSNSPDAASVLLRSGAVAIINGSQKIGRRRLSLAHELGHVLVADEYTVDWHIDQDSDPNREENAMDRFARALLLPHDSIVLQWRQLVDECDGDIRIPAVRIASHFRVDMATLARRLRNLRAIDKSQSDFIRTIRTTRADIAEYDLVVGEELVVKTLPREYERAVLRLYKSEIVSEARALELLFETWSVEDLPSLPELPESSIWEYV